MSENKRYTLGLDYGTKYCHAILVDVGNGKLVASVDYPYPHGIISGRLPNSDITLEDDVLLFHPSDLITTLKRAIPKLLRESQIDPQQLIGIGVAFAGSIVLPTTSDGTPLALLEDYAHNPDAWPRLWHDRSAQPKADRITQMAAERFETFLDRYGGKIDAEWFFPKVWDLWDRSSSIYHAANRIIEASDWLVWQLTGVETRNISAAGYKALWSKSEGFPLETFFGALDSGLANVVDEKMKREITPLGQQVGELTEEAAQWMNLIPGIPVAAGMLNNQAAVPGTSVVDPGNMAILMGDHFRHFVLSDKAYRVPGMSGMVEDGIVPGHIGYEADQIGSGDHFSWFMENAVPAFIASEARKRKMSLFDLMEEKATALQPAESGLIALDWWSGNRSILVDDDLSGLVLGYTLRTKPEEIYRALLEATAFGTRKIFETFIASGVPVNEIIVSGNGPMHNKLLMNILANVTRMEIKQADCPYPAALGSAMYAAVAAGQARGGYATIQDASRKMAHLRKQTFMPNNNDKKTYNRLYTEYTLLHDYFGYGHNNAMKRLSNLRDTILAKKRQ